MRTRHRRLALPARLVAVALAVASIGVAGCTTGGGGGSGGSDGSTLTLSSSREFGTWAIGELSGSESATYWTAVYDTIVRRKAEDGSPAPGLASAWTYNNDKTVLTLTLRTGQKFTDGTAVTADVVAKNLQFSKSKNCSSGLSAVEAIKATGDATVVLTLSAPEPALLNFLANTCGAIGNPKLFDTKDGATSPEGSGPYTLDAGRTQAPSAFTFVKNKDYWNATAYPYETVVIKGMPDVTARFNALRSGQIDAATLTPVTATAAKDAGFTVQTHLFRWTGFFILDRSGKKVPALGDVRVRQAINLAFDREAIIKSLVLGYGTPTDQPYIEGNAMHLGGPLKYGYDVDKAKRLLAEAGYPNGFTLTLPAVPREGIQEFSAIVKDSLGAIGITVNYTPEPADTYQARFIKGDYPMFFMRFESQDAWYDVRQALFPNSNWNGMHYEDPKLAAMVKRAQFAASDEDARAVYQEIGTYVRDQAWFAPLWWSDSIVATGKTVKVVTRTGMPDSFIEDYSPATN